MRKVKTPVWESNVNLFNRKKGSMCISYWWDCNAFSYNRASFSADNGLYGTQVPPSLDQSPPSLLMYWWVVQWLCCSGEGCGTNEWPMRVTRSSRWRFPRVPSVSIPIAPTRVRYPHYTRHVNNPASGLGLRASSPMHNLQRSDSLFTKTWCGYGRRDVRGSIFSLDHEPLRTPGDFHKSCPSVLSVPLSRLSHFVAYLFVSVLLAFKRLWT